MAARTTRTAKRPAQGQTSSQEAPIRISSGWTPTRIETARKYADSGDLSLAADLWERVMGDERAIGPLQALCGIPGLPLSFESLSGNEEDPRVKALEEDFWEALPDEVLAEVIRWCSGLGVALLHVSEWQVVGSRVLPVCEVWHPRCLRWDSVAKQWGVRTAASPNVAVPIEPGDGEWVIITPYGRSRPWAKAPWYALGLLWLIASYAKLDWADYNDAHGKPLRVAANTTPEKAGLSDDRELQALADKINALARGGTIVLPDGFELSLLEATARGWDSFVKLIDEVWPKAISIALTGQNLATQVQGGSFAAAAVHATVSHDRIRTFAESLAVETRRQLLEWWAEFNFGDRDVPWIKWDTSQPADRQAEAARLAQLAAAITSLSAASIPLDFEVLERDYGLPVDLERLGEAPPALFAQHHLALGIVTVNEARAQLRLPPIPDGDKLVAAPAPPTPGGFPPPGFGGADDDEDEPDAKPEPPADEDEDEPDEDAEELHRLEHLDPVELSARSEAALIDGFTRGTLSRGAEALAGDIDDLVGIVKRSDTPEEVYRQLVEHYANKDTPQEFLDRIERTMVLAAMQGRYSAVRSV